MVEQISEIVDGSRPQGFFPLLATPSEVSTRRLNKAASPSTPASDNQTLFSERGKCLAQGHCRDAQLLGQLRFGWKSRSRRKQAHADGFGQLLNDLPGPALL